MKAFKMLCICMLIVSCSKTSFLLDADDFRYDEFDEYTNNCSELEFEDKLTPLFYKNTKKDTPEFYFNPSLVYNKLYHNKCKGVEKEKVTIVNSEWRTFPGGLGDQEEVVYLEILIGQSEEVQSFKAKSDVYWFLSGSREAALRQAITRVLESIHRIRHQN